METGSGQSPAVLDLSSAAPAPALGTRAKPCAQPATGTPSWKQAGPLSFRDRYKEPRFNVHITDLDVYVCVRVTCVYFHRRGN